MLPVVDAALAIWVAAWIGLGVAIGINVHNLTHLSHTVITEGRAVESVGHTLRSLGGAPFVGGEISDAGHRVEAAGASAVYGGQSSTSSIRTLSILLAIAVALLPSVPVFGFYVPLRVKRSREARALRRAVREHGDERDFQSFLAHRAIGSLDYWRLRELSAAPWAGLENGDCEALAAAELRRLGIDPRLLHPTAVRNRS